jgi:D-alanine-D-alanine ligase
VSSTTATLPERPRLDSGLYVGLTYDLREEYLRMGYSEEETAELDQPGTIEALEHALRALGMRTDRIGHSRQLMQRLERGDRWDLVFNIAEGLFGLGRESLVPALLDGYRIPYTFSDPAVMAVTLQKALAKRVVRDAGVPTADFVVVESEADCDDVHLEVPLFVKPLAEGTGKGVTKDSIVRRRRDLRPACRRLLGDYRQPVLVEALLPGREVTVGIVGTGRAAQALGTLEVVLRPGAEEGVYSYTNKEHCEELVEYRLLRGEAEPLAREAEEVALRAWRALGCRDGGRVDLRCDAEGRCNFLEVNPLAGLHPTHSDLPILCTLQGMSYLSLIESIVSSAMARVGAAVA